MKLPVRGLQVPGLCIECDALCVCCRSFNALDGYPTGTSALVAGLGTRYARWVFRRSNSYHRCVHVEITREIHEFCSMQGAFSTSPALFPSRDARLTQEGR